MQRRGTRSVVTTAYKLYDSMLRWLPALGLIWLVSGCAGKPPKGLEPLAGEALGPATVRNQESGWLGGEVRWGGDILTVRNRPGDTEIEVFHRPLGANAEPEPEGGDGVRFLARIEGFLDPAAYQPGKRLTVRGTLAPVVSRNVGEYPYRYPVVDVGVFHLWPAYEPVSAPHWHHPYYDPWWPYGPWGPWRRHPYWW